MGMSKLVKRAIYAVVGLVVLAVAGAVIFASVYDWNKFKPRIEEAAAEATGLPLKINGDIGLKFFPGPAVSVKDVRLGEEKAPVVSAGEINAAVSLLPLLKKKVEVGKIEIVKPSINIVRYKNGKYNYEGKKKKEADKKAQKEAAAPALFVGKVEISHGEFNYQDMGSDSRVALKDFNLTAKDLSIDRAAGEILKGLSLNGSFDAESLTAGKYAVSDMDMKYKMKGGVLDVNPVSMKLFGGAASGNCAVDFTRKKPRISVAQDIRGLDLGMLVRQASGKDTLEGKVDVKAKLGMDGFSSSDIRRTMTGDFSMHGADMAMKGADLDTTIAKLERSGQFNLLDLGSVFVLGPFGPLLTKSADIVGTSSGLGEGRQSLIKKIVFDWDVKDGVATARDAAFATAKNRMAFQGQLDFVNERFLDLRAGVLDARGCTTFEQTIVGPFSKPTVKKEGVVKSIIKPFASLFGTAKEAVAGPAECTVPFYEGSVEHPTP